jgi:V/A-type H+-transporting ATPase subunit E
MYQVMAENTLDSLINTLKTEAIEAADQEARLVLDKAREEAKSIIKEATAARDKIIREAEQTAQATVRNGEATLAQAARDVKLKLGQELLELLGAILGREVESVFDQDLTQKAVLMAIENVGTGITISLPVEMKETLAEFVRNRAGNSNDLPEIAGSEGLLRGFNISKKEEGWTFSITPEEVSALLVEQLSGKWATMLKNASQS